MVLKIISQGSHQKIVNGKPLVNKKFNVGIDSTKMPHRQVYAQVLDDNQHFETQDSLSNFMNNLRQNNNSLFDLMKNDKNKLNQQPDVKLVSTCVKKIPISVKFLKNTRKSTDGKKGIRQKIFNLKKYKLKVKNTRRLKSKNLIDVKNKKQRATKRAPKKKYSRKKSLDKTA